MTYSEKCADSELSRQGTKLGNLTKLFSRLVLYLTVNQRETTAQVLQVQHNNSRKTWNWTQIISCSKQVSGTWRETSRSRNSVMFLKYYISNRNKASFTTVLPPLDFYDQINIKSTKYTHAYPAALLLEYRNIRIRSGRVIFDWDDRYLSCSPKLIHFSAVLQLCRMLQDGKVGLL